MNKSFPDTEGALKVIQIKKKFDFENGFR